MPKVIRYYIVAIIVLLTFLSGLGAGIWAGSRKTSALAEDLRSAQDRAESLEQQLRAAESGHRALEEALRRARLDLGAAQGRVDELADRLRAERELLAGLEERLAESEGRAGRVDELITEGERIIAELLTEKAP